MKDAAEISMGTEVSEDDIANVLQLCDQVVSLSEYRAQLWDYLRNRMQARRTRARTHTHTRTDTRTHTHPPPPLEATCGSGAQRARTHAHPMPAHRTPHARPLRTRAMTRVCNGNLSYAP